MASQSDPDPVLGIPVGRVPSWLRRLGTSAWYLLGVGLLLVGAYYGLARLSALLVPLVVAVVLGMIFYPLVDLMRSRGKVPNGLGATIVMLGLVAMAASAVWLAVLGVIDQSTDITEQVESGWKQIQDILADLGVDLDDLSGLWASVSGNAGASISGLIQQGFSSAAAFAIGLFIGAFLLFYLLKDWHTLADWTASHLGVPEELGQGLIADATSAIRRYFYGITLASIPVSVGIGVAMWALGLPLAATVALVTFVTSYIPYLGAIFSGAFTVLIALGAGGLTEAAIMLAVVLFTQNGLQTIVQTKLTSDQLALHPVVNLGSTIVGATVAGLLGATLSAPIVAMVIATQRRVMSYYRLDSRPEASAPAAPETKGAAGGGGPAGVGSDSVVGTEP